MKNISTKELLDLVKPFEGEINQNLMGIYNKIKDIPDPKISEVDLVRDGVNFFTYGMSKRASLCQKKELKGVVKEILPKKINKKYIVERLYIIMYDFIKNVIPGCEWHHVSGCPNNREYFLWAFEIEKIIDNGGIVKLLVEKYECIKLHSIATRLRSKKEKIIKRIGVEFYRTSSVPTKEGYRAIITREEMKGKYGYFPADSKYKLPVYYSGYLLKEEDYEIFK